MRVIRFTRSRPHTPHRSALSRPRRIPRGAAPPRRRNPRPNRHQSADASGGEDDAAVAAEADDEARRPFTVRSQVHADLALARVLPKQERPYMMLRMNGGGEDSDYGSYQYDEDAEDDREEELAHHLRVHDHEHPGSVDGDGDDNVEAEGEGKGEVELSEVRKRSQSTRMTRLTPTTMRKGWRWSMSRVT